ncbi:MAG: hypothetical protein AB7Q69_00430, partial [Gemmatimonadales bacterium]
DGAAARTAATWRAGAGYRFSPTVNAGIGYAHYPFDETAFLITGDLDLDAVDGSVDYLVRRGTTLSAGGGVAWFSDGNYRTAGILALNQELGRGFYAGAMGRRLSYDFKGLGYFSPDRFSVAEARGGYAFSNSRWNARASAGLGIQQVTRDGVTQSQWHIELRAGHTWGLANSVEGFAGYSTSAESSTTGAFKWGTAGIILRIGL